MEKTDKSKVEIRDEAEESAASRKSRSKKDDPNERGDQLNDLKNKLAAAYEEAKENYDRLLRVSAEFDNYKKRTAREMEDFRKYANESLLKEILLLVDNLERALKSSEDNGHTDTRLVEGINMTIHDILKVFEKFSVKPIESLREPFDPNFHEAVMQIETEKHPENIVLKEFQKGYMIHDRLLRPAMVAVSKKKEGTGEAQEAEIGERE